MNAAESILKRFFDTEECWWMVSGEGAPGGDFFKIDGAIEITHEERLYLASLNDNRWSSTHPLELVAPEDLVPT